MQQWLSYCVAWLSFQTCQTVLQHPFETAKRERLTRLKYKYVFLPSSPFPPTTLVQYICFVENWYGKCTLNMSGKM